MKLHRIPGFSAFFSEKRMGWGTFHLPISLFFLFIIIVVPGQGQSKIVLNDDVHLVLNGGSSVEPIYVVLNNDNPNALQTTGSGGNLKSENEFNILRWHVGSLTGNYVIPFTSASNTKIPFSFEVVTPGIPGGSDPYIDFSTYSTDNYNVVYPSMVTNMLDAPTNSSDASLEAIDRFWIINARETYTTAPATIFHFGYDTAEAGGLNTITSGTLQAQRFSTSDSAWGIIGGTDNTSINTVENTNVSSSDLYQAWTLVDNAVPLKTDLLTFTLQCNGDHVRIEWTTKKESGSSGYVIEKSEDGFNWQLLSSVTDNKEYTSGTPYRYQDYAMKNTQAYYRLAEINEDGMINVFGVKYISNCHSNKNSVQLTQQGNGNYQLHINSDRDLSLNVMLTDMHGKLVKQPQTLEVVKGENVFFFEGNELTNGLYILTIIDKDFRFNGRIVKLN